MTKVSTIKKIVVEDFPKESRELIEKLSGAINPFLDQGSQALSKQLTLADNLKCKTYDLTLAAGVSTIDVGWDLNEKPTSITLGNVTLTDGSAPLSAFSLSSYYSNGKIALRLLGLSASSAHKIIVVAQV